MNQTAASKPSTILATLVGILSLGAATAGLSTGTQGTVRSALTVFGETVPLYGHGLYRHDSISVAEQAVGQDIVTLGVAIPLLGLALFLARRGRLKGQLLLTGTFGYFFYTYASYAFLAMYNAFFLVYVAVMSLSLFGFVLSWSSVDLKKLAPSAQPKFPAKRTAAFLFFAAAAVGLMWTGRIAPGLFSDPMQPPIGLDHYTTLVIQALDLGIVAPAAAVAAVLLLRKKASGYLLSSVLVLKECTMLTAISSMLVRMRMAGVEISIVELLLFPAMNAVVVYLLIAMLRSLNEIDAPGRTPT
ncbi:hypothetical protein FE782_29050 [Paenibacillus antri]|uniref:Uncharacterized protein n=1 Tax=Paenibacillus antri TaxID=2582848 RepID=A0A5R9G6U0_9BACL|nr:hypothetical protein [Paenibacillus antri]TLS48694.1 hypothetical protein FE782_29050 [Paenibacillus antri]